MMIQGPKQFPYPCPSAPSAVNNFRQKTADNPDCTDDDAGSGPSTSIRLSVVQVPEQRAPTDFQI